MTMKTVPVTALTALVGAAALLTGCGTSPQPAATPTSSATVSSAMATRVPAASPTTASGSATTPSPTTATTPPSPSTSWPTALAGPGSIGPYVVATQLRLGLPVEGVYGPDTAHAVAVFQRSHALPATGTVDAATWAVLRNVANPCPQPATGAVRTAPGTDKTVALTFDDGASPYTSRILAVLARYRVHATFFDTGFGDSTYPLLARSILAAGDVLGNHTYSHLKNWGFGRYFSPSTQRGELTRTNAVQTAIIGHSPCLMRPPGGAYDAASLALSRSLGMSLVMWTTDALDWQQPPRLSPAFQHRIIRRVEAGADLSHPIILLHSGKASHEPECDPTGCQPGQVSSFRGNTVAALPAIIEFYLARGYRFVTL